MKFIPIYKSFFEPLEEDGLQSGPAIGGIVSTNYNTSSRPESLKGTGDLTPKKKKKKADEEAK